MEYLTNNIIEGRWVALENSKNIDQFSKSTQSLLGKTKWKEINQQVRRSAGIELF